MAFLSRILGVFAVAGMLCMSVLSYAADETTTAQTNPPDAELDTLYNIITDLNWDVDDDNEERQEIWAKITELQQKLNANMAALQENYDNMKAKEQSAANRLIGAVGVGATGIGGMMAASAMAETKADEDAERDMKAYLETMRCDYGDGMNIRGGDTGIELPGANDLAQLHIEYALLVESLTEAKAALGMTPGIEAEATVDKANTGLYDNAAIGKTGGAYFSIARALQDPQGIDATEWEAEKAAAKKKLKTGAIVAGVGAAGSLIANVIINARGVKEDSATLLRQRDEVKSELKNLIHMEIERCNDKIRTSRNLVAQIKADPILMQYQILADYVAAVDGLPLLENDTDIIQLKAHPLCR